MMGLTLNHPAEVISMPQAREKFIGKATPAQTTYRRHTWRDRTLIKTHIVAMIIGAVLWSQMTTHHGEPKAGASTPPTSLAGKAPAASQGP